jgi:hypothetical protein
LKGGFLNENDRIEQATRAEGFEVEKRGSTRGLAVILGTAAVLLLVLIIAGIWYLSQPGAPTETIRDIFIILLGLEFMIIGIALVILVIQLARLINMLNNEVRPILDSANEAANTMRGTARFLSDKLVAPVVKVNASAAAVRRALDMLRFWKR